MTGMGTTPIVDPLAGPQVYMMTEGVRFPPLCAHCAAAGSRRLAIERNFGSVENALIVAMSPLFCEACVESHWKEVQPIPLADQLRHLLWNIYMIPIAG